MATFLEILETRARTVDSLLCVGLDPHLQDLVAPTPQAVETFCMRLIDATASVALAFKPNSAFFEVLGSQGMSMLERVIRSIPKEIPVILDAKRGDIASTAEAYARAAFKGLGARAVTIHPYLGRDSVEPFLQDESCGAFLLCRTSNPGARDLQDLRLQGPVEEGKESPARYLYEWVAQLARQWNAKGNLGLVVGATYPQELARVRFLAPDAWILAPGVGAQGGDLKLALEAGLRLDGSGLIIPVSRTISRSADPRKEASRLRDEINAVREAYLASQSSASGDMRLEAASSGVEGMLADALLEAGCVRFGSFTLKSGLVSPIYIDLRRLASYPSVLDLVAQAYLPVLRSLSFDRLAALPYAALPIGTAISLKGGWPLIYPRKEAKEYGTKAEIEGVYNPGERLVVIDDLATTGGSKFEAIEKLSSAGLKISDIVVLIDRQSGAAESLAAAGYRLHAVLTLSQLLDYWERARKAPAEQIAAAREFLKSAG
jgi:uridine monophosphate synthetase